LRLISAKIKVAYGFKGFSISLESFHAIRSQNDERCSFVIAGQLKDVPSAFDVRAHFMTALLGLYIQASERNVIARSYEIRDAFPSRPFAFRESPGVGHARTFWSSSLAS
jgi:hypothetical protein